MNGPKQGKILILIVVPEVRKEAFKEKVRRKCSWLTCLVY